MTKILLVRHGEINNPAGIIYGRLPGFVMTERGRKQVRQVAEKLENEGVQKIYTSPRQRAGQTAKILAERLKVKIEEDGRLDETNSPIDGKMTFKEAREKGVSGYDPEFIQAGGETEAEAAERMRAFVEEKVVEWREKTVLAVSHGDPIWFLRATLMNLPVAVSKLKGVVAYPALASVTEVEVGDDDALVVKWEG